MTYKSLENLKNYNILIQQKTSILFIKDLKFSWLNYRECVFLNSYVQHHTWSTTAWISNTLIAVHLQQEKGTPALFQYDLFFL
jgi:hypothetical protein